MAERFSIVIPQNLIPAAFVELLERRPAVGYVTSTGFGFLSFLGKQVGALITTQNAFEVLGRVFLVVGWIGVLAGTTGAILTALIQLDTWKERRRKRRMKGHD